MRPGRKRAPTFRAFLSLSKIELRSVIIVSCARRYVQKNPRELLSAIAHVRAGTLTKRRQPGTDRLLTAWLDVYLSVQPRQTDALPALPGEGRMRSVLRPAKKAPLKTLLSLCLGLCTTSVHAERQHIVAAGQSLEVIAKRYKRSAEELAAANGLKKEVALRGGQVLTVPSDGVVYVTEGQTLSSIAHAHNLGSMTLAKANNLDPTSTLRIGQKLMLPGYAAHAKQTAGEKRWGQPKQRGVAKMYRIWSEQTAIVRLVDTRGAVRPAAQRQMRELMRPRDTKKRKNPNTRLLGLLAQVSDHFGGRPIHIISGYRTAGGLTRDTSRHVAGDAIDFRIPGVSLEELRDYCAHFANVGVGLYPRSQFIHLDVRKKSARWTDWSLPGQAAILQKPADPDESAASTPRNDEIPEPSEAASEPPAPTAPAEDGAPSVPAQRG